MSGYDVATPSSSHNYLDWRRTRISEGQRSLNRKRGSWNHYVLESESSCESDDGSDTAHSIQGKETDLARDTSDLEWSGDDSAASVVEYEVVSTDADLPDDKPSQFVDSNSSSGSSGDELLTTTVIHAMLNDVDFVSADSEDSMSAASTDSELSPFDYWNCAQCRTTNNNPMFRYCEKCYKVRKDFFPPRPKRKRPKLKKNSKKQKRSSGPVRPEGMLSEGRGIARGLESEVIESPAVELDFQNIKVPNSVMSDNRPSALALHTTVAPDDENTLKSLRDTAELKSKQFSEAGENIEQKETRKRSIDTEGGDKVVKRTKRDMTESSVIKKNLNNNIILSDNYKAQSRINVETSPLDNCQSFSQPVFPDFECDVEPLTKTLSDPALVFSKDRMDLISRKHFTDDECDIVKADLLTRPKQKSINLTKQADSDMCITCLVEPKSGVFVHGRIAHICCCYKCSVKVWIKTKCCPICNCKVSNVLKAFVM